MLRWKKKQHCIGVRTGLFPIEWARKGIVSRVYQEWIYHKVNISQSEYITKWIYHKLNIPWVNIPQIEYTMSEYTTSEYTMREYTTSEYTMS